MERRRVDRRSFLRNAALIAVGILLSKAEERMSPRIKEELGEKRKKTALARWWREGEIPQTSKEWKDLVNLFAAGLFSDEDWEKNLLPPSTPLEEVIAFYPFCSFSSEEEFFEEQRGLIQACSDYFVLPEIYRRNPKRGIVLSQAIIMKPGKFWPQGDWKRFAESHSLSEKEIVGLEIMLALLGSLTQKGPPEEQIPRWKSGTSSPPLPVLTNVVGFKAFNERGELVLPIFDLQARVYLLEPWLAKCGSPALYEKIAQIDDPLTVILRSLRISSARVREFYRQGDVVGFLRFLGRALYRRGLRPYSKAGEIQGDEEIVADLLGLQTAFCLDLFAHSRNCYFSLEEIYRNLFSLPRDRFFFLQAA